MGLAAFLGITLHALIDGFALGAGLTIPHLSVAVTAAIVLHKLPASLSLSGILLHCEYPRRRIAVMMILFSLATPIGAVISYYVLRDLSGAALPFAIAFSAGTFLAIATADLLPQIHSAPKGRFWNLAALFAGLLVISLADDIAPHGHAHGSETEAPAGTETSHEHGEERTASEDGH
jgi:zinc transporter ZupT